MFLQLQKGEIIYDSIYIAKYRCRSVMALE